MRLINEIIVHCADTYADMDIGVEEIRRWHLDRGWDDIGYHLVIRRDGDPELGRPIEKPGAHAAERNANSIGICLVGGRGEDGKPDFNFTAKQMATLQAAIGMYKVIHPGIDSVIGHRDVSDKSCPAFNIQAFLSD
jgi:hypothetical protein